MLLRVKKGSTELWINSTALAQHLSRGWSLLSLQTGEIETVEDSGSAVLVDAAVSGVWQITLTANAAIDLQSYNLDTAELTLLLTQDASGGHTPTWPLGVTWADGTPSIDQTGGNTTVISLSTYDGGSSWDGKAAWAAGLQLASVAESRAGTDTTKAVPPAGLPLRVEGNALVRQDGYGGAPRGSGAVDLQVYQGPPSQVASGKKAVISGGSRNTASNDYSIVNGGLMNTNGGAYSVIDGGLYNTLEGDYSSIGGGYTITVSGDYTTVPGGRNLTVSGDRSFAIGAPSSTVTLAADDANYVYGMRSYLSAPATAPNDSDLVEPGSLTFYLDETGHALKFRVKYSDGLTMKTGTVALT